jgi:iron complex transport system substrate-binding protein
VARKLPARFRRDKKPPFRAAGAAPALLFALACGAGEPADDRAAVPTDVAFAPADAARLKAPDFTWTTPPPEAAPRRIVSLIPSVTETLFVLGLGDRLVARSAWCDWPPEALSLPDVGRQQDLSAEKVASLRPDLVLTWRYLPDLRRAMVAVFGLRAIAPGTELKEEALAGIEETAEACGVPERGRALVAKIRADMDAVAARYAGRPRRRVLVVLDRNPLFAPGGASFLDEMLTLVGAENVAAREGDGAWTRFSAEKALDWNPEVVIDISTGEPSEAAAAAAYWARFREIDAVKNGKVRIVAAGVLVRPGPRMAAVADLYGRWIHGE